MYILYKVKISSTEDCVYRFCPDELSRQRGANEYTLKANREIMKKLLRRFGSADEISSPRSKRGYTYDQLLDFIHTNKNNSFYIFGHKYPKDLDTLNRMSV